MTGCPFTFESERLALPRGAAAHSRRCWLRWQGRPVLATTQGRRRAYVFPLYTPAGALVTTESPADHPHHNSVWVAADHVHCRFPSSVAAYEDGTYNFYVDDVFQGRAPGRIVERSVDATALDGETFRITQVLDWIGPAEWGAPDGRRIAAETRTLDVRCGTQAHIIDIRSTIAAVEWDLTVGPTRHAWFGVRLAESMRAQEGGTLADADGRRGGEAITWAESAWLHACGPVAGGMAGIAVLPDPAERWGGWFATDWGTIAVNPVLNRQRLVTKDQACGFAMRLVVHDGGEDAVDVPALFAAYRSSRNAG